MNSTSVTGTFLLSLPLQLMTNELLLFAGVCRRFETQSATDLVIVVVRIEQAHKSFI